MFDRLRHDGAAYAPYGGWYRNVGFWVVATHRFGAWARSVRPAALRLPLLVLYAVARFPWQFFLHVELPASARIGGGLLLLHPYAILLGGGVEIGEDCAVYHEVTIGLGPKPGLPRIGSRVALFVGSRVLGGVRIGDGCEIGANCVVTRDLPPGSVVAAPPARVMPNALVRPGSEPAVTPAPGRAVAPDGN